ncbi:tachykinin-4 isoform X2 [Ursus maritimus]|uniref:Tachykinin-4 isoform X2 n=1 Tax=Ursus maritimus TaxID=29073 RepID=A0A8M1GJG8_URSMA|nr:tachykinin-4 isoform X2 [Ursus maritimus]
MLSDSPLRGGSKPQPLAWQTSKGARVRGSHGWWHSPPAPGGEEGQSEPVLWADGEAGERNTSYPARQKSSSTTRALARTKGAGPSGQGGTICGRQRGQGPRVRVSAPTAPFPEDETPVSFPGRWSDSQPGQLSSLCVSCDRHCCVPPSLPAVPSRTLDPKPW